MDITFLEAMGTYVPGCSLLIGFLQGSAMSTRTTEHTLQLRKWIVTQRLRYGAMWLAHCLNSWLVVWVFSLQGSEDFLVQLRAWRDIGDGTVTLSALLMLAINMLISAYGSRHIYRYPSLAAHRHRDGTYCQTVYYRESKHTHTPLEIVLLPRGNGSFKRAFMPPQ